MFCPQLFAKPYPSYLLVLPSTFGSTHLPNLTPFMGIILAVLHQRRSGDKVPSTCMKLRATAVPISYGAVQLPPVKEQEVSGSE